MREIIVIIKAYIFFGRFYDPSPGFIVATDSKFFKLCSAAKASRLAKTTSSWKGFHFSAGESGLLLHRLDIVRLLRVGLVGRTFLLVSVCSCSCPSKAVSISRGKILFQILHQCWFGLEMAIITIEDNHPSIKVLEIT